MTTLHTHNVLCVGDNNVLELLLSELERCRIYEVSTVREFSAALADGSIDIILLDLQMLDINALELAELVKAEKLHIPIVFLTDEFRLDAFIQQGYKSGTIDYLTKPIDHNQFLNKMNLYLRLFDKEKSLRELNDTLHRHVWEQLARHRQNDCILSHQARLASVGETIVQIAHHWRQPINTIGLLIQDILDAYDFNELNREYIRGNVNKCMDIIEKMSDTIDELRGFYKSDAVKTAFMLNRTIEKTVSFIKPILIEHNINIIVNNSTDTQLTGYPVEFGRVVVSLINNAKDALTENCIERPVIKIDSFVEEDRAVIVITDNGGGVPPEIAGRIFDPYFTTKEEGRAAGLGLYTSKHLIEKCMGGTLSFKNIADGAEFKISLPILNPHRAHSVG
ncbi:sensor histidine kinase [Candidatus Magnetominusculus xianensis]|uniref:histidine kinase n=1 Tax=Candidatus Magnetominusculus xianensis TaxID=1748249 RepID=A0ABR5SDQ3_9BACT|nr:hybrid sensor histidine kinase/response regulator [Candidatus Magnetominusculus xianensis]KWT79386.1 two-component system sensor histidine kinase [Candidatus Magnetominusculus xianensis]MBF0405493.1 hybrid sensor histidine kinase/response regulator [Nitrospirota bacterium]